MKCILSLLVDLVSVQRKRFHNSDSRNGRTFAVVVADKVAGCTVVAALMLVHILVAKLGILASMEVKRGWVVGI